MVHIKRIELTNFKSFGGTTAIPFLPGFTVVSGPNGSGKSNILDALLFALGLSSSKGMRAERLPDLVNNAQTRRGTVETIVTVTFDLTDLSPDSEFTGQVPGKSPHEELEPAPETETEDEPIILPDNPLTDLEEPIQSETPAPHPFTLNPEAEWSVSRKLRVTKQGSYTSTYLINGQPCTLTELHEQLNRLRIYPEGYNVVLQGDVTGIISMKPKERREIIDELAGVAQFDRKITIAKQKLDEVKEREDRNRIVEKELIDQRDRLDKDRAKAEKYQRLRSEFQEKSQLEAVLKWKHLKQKEWKLREQIEAGDRQTVDLTEQLQRQRQEIEQGATELEKLNAQVKALGEEELIALQSTLATQEAQKAQLATRRQELETRMADNLRQTQQLGQEIQDYQTTFQQNLTLLSTQQQERDRLQQLKDHAQAQLTQQRQSADAIASTAEAWVQQQTDLHHHIEELQKTLAPQRTEQATLRERVEQLSKQVQEQQQSLESIITALAQKQADHDQMESARQVTAEQVKTLAQTVKEAEEDLQVQQETKVRLLEEQRERQRKLDKLEAQQQALQESTGTHATQIIEKAGLSGVCGLVAHLGRVETKYQLALEIAAGGRLGFLVVEDDSVAAAGIELLKQKRAGRLTFLPLNKIRGSRLITNNNLEASAGFVDYAVNLVDCDPCYDEIFSYVFGNTVVFTNLTEARRYLGQYRLVTLEGELLETSGAMTGGSVANRSTIHFGTSSESVESRVIASLQERLAEIERILQRCDSIISEATLSLKQNSQALMEAKQTLREQVLKVEQMGGEIKSLATQKSQLESQLSKNQQEWETAQNRLTLLNTELPQQEERLEEYRQNLSQLEASHTHSEWQQMQLQLRSQETELEKHTQALTQVQQELRDLENQQQRLEEKSATSQRRVAELTQEHTTLREQQSTLKSQLLAIEEQIAQTQGAMKQVEARLGTQKQVRDQAETRLTEQRLAQQQLEWQLEKLQTEQLEKRQQLTTLREDLQTAQAELPDPLPEVPEGMEKRLTTALHELEQDLKNLQKRLQALEPVNMLALEEYNRTQERLQELSQKLATLEGERTELLLRIENFTTLRRRSFQEAFDAVDANFQTIFAALSEGDGHLELDNQEDPFNSGLNLVAHPKGKPVQRLASMSGGEKSLTALSFIFSLQRYRPSTFYAFDEVDMFLDGANVERLARMIKRQAEQAQFIVVSLRRPMMEASERAIGVTQARGAYTQVIGLKLSGSETDKS